MDAMGKVKTHAMKGSKFGNKKTEVDGIMFDSKREAARYQALKLMAHAGEITELELQVRFPIRVNGQEVCCYISDFTYRPRGGGSLVVEDCKGAKTETYLLKKKLLKAIHGIEILET
jgi:hypothetical protein